MSGIKGTWSDEKRGVGSKEWLHGRTVQREEEGGVSSKERLHFYDTRYLL